ncbi:putative eukaryotic translation initiation factor 5A-4-like [Capsicum annuum]|uniref:Uncharacterized protein n=2 Tax=Capsicum annuum TaxID=4072 RepID=A0A2G3AJE3_CAPAN|nr:putative eukaryotic translation initiation factor 5A-4-like [Capsicum annuum]KAF3660884.1 putative eukaryotic translation initiation factor 5A-4-like [Capsicum annuum]PHT94320.1 hypothetical protein T459_02202 [Capsicum annuum]
MGTQVHYKGYLPAYYSMRDLSEDSNSSNWPLFYEDKTFSNGQYCNGFMSRTTTDAYPGYNKDVLKEKMLEHESIFKNQVVELHRLHRIQRDMMDEIKREELHRLRASMDPSSSSSHIGSQVPSEDARKWHITSFPSANSGCPRTFKLGTEVVNSPLRFSKGNSECQLRNGCSSNICEVLEVRPSKVRKMLFDLELPADEYNETDSSEQLQVNGGSFNPSYRVNGNYTVAQESSAKLFHGDDAVAKSNCGNNASTSSTWFRSSNLLTDLNEPAQLEEANPAPVDFLGYGNNHRESRGLNVSAKSNPAFVTSPRETTWNSHHASPNGSLNSLYIANKGKERDWFSSSYGTGNIKGSMAPAPQSLEQDKFPTPFHQVHVMLNKAYQPPGIHLFHHTRNDPWKQRAVHSLETFHINREPNYTHVRSFDGSQMSPHPFANSSVLPNSWSRTVFSRGKPSGDFTQRPSSVHTSPSLLSASVNKSGQASQSHGFFGEKWQISDRSKLNPGLASDLPILGRFDQGSSSATKVSPVCFPSVAFDSLDRAKVEPLTSERLSTNGFQKILNSPNYRNSTSEKGFDLNLLSESSLDEETPEFDMRLVDGKRELQDPLSVLPWLKAKQCRRNEDTDTMRGVNSTASGFPQAYASPPSCQTNTLKNASSLEDCNASATKEFGETRSIQKILGVPILENSLASKTESSSLVSTCVTLQFSPEGENFGHERRKMLIDINMPCDLSMTEPEKPDAIEPLVPEKVMETKVNNIRSCFDLNSCITEDEDPFSVESNNVGVKAVLEIDLEAPFVLDAEQTDLQMDMPEEDDKQYEECSQLVEDNPEQKRDEIDRIAAEAIVAISLSSQCILMEEACCDPSDDPLESLRWFVDVVSSFADEPENGPERGTISEDVAIVAHSTAKELDYFEAMTLQLTETKKEDYMPKPFVPEFQTVEDAGATSLTNRPRRGPARRGRQRRDFQRDILPGLVSLSRHEVTEDLQTFGGLMRATGHTWSSGLTRRTGSRNGRSRRTVIESIAPVTVLTTISPPLLHQLNNMEGSLEDKSLTGWGKTTRRPRRQRCPAGNPPAPLT